MVHSKILLPKFLSFILVVVRGGGNIKEGYLLLPQLNQSGQVHMMCCVAMALSDTLIATSRSDSENKSAYLEKSTCGSALNI